MENFHILENIWAHSSNSDEEKEGKNKGDKMQIEPNYSSSGHDHRMLTMRPANTRSCGRQTPAHVLEPWIGLRLSAAVTRMRDMLPSCLRRMAGGSGTPLAGRREAAEPGLDGLGVMAGVDRRGDSTFAPATGAGRGRAYPSGDVTRKAIAAKKGTMAMWFRDVTVTGGLRKRL